MEKEQVWSGSKVSREERFEEDVKEGEEDYKDDSSDEEDGQDGCKDDASDESQTSDLGISPDLSIRGCGNYKKHIVVYHLFIYSIFKLDMAIQIYKFTRMLRSVIES